MVTFYINKVQHVYIKLIKSKYLIMKPLYFLMFSFLFILGSCCTECGKNLKKCQEDLKNSQRSKSFSQLDSNKWYKGIVLSDKPNSSAQSLYDKKRILRLLHSNDLFPDRQEANYHAPCILIENDTIDQNVTYYFRLKETNHNIEIIAISTSHLWSPPNIANLKSDFGRYLFNFHLSRADGWHSKLHKISYNRKEGSLFIYDGYTANRTTPSLTFSKTYKLDEATINSFRSIYVELNNPTDGSAIFVGGEISNIHNHPGHVNGN